MVEARFVLYKGRVIEQYNKLRELGVRVSYSYKTNRDVGNVLQEDDKLLMYCNSALVTDPSAILTASIPLPSSDFRPHLA